MKYLAVLGRQPKISLAELEALFQEVRPVGPELAEFLTDENSPIDDSYIFPDIARLGGTQKIAAEIEGGFKGVLDDIMFDATLPTGKIVLGVSDYSRGATAYKSQGEALKIKRILTKQGRNVRVIPNKEAALSSATSFHNRLWLRNHIEIIKNGKNYYRVVRVQNIGAYAERDQARPARDAKVGMLPPKLAQILINLCGNLPEGSRVLDPFCGTGVVLQEAALMRYRVYGTDINERMVEYSERNLEWLYGGRIANPASSGPAPGRSGQVFMVRRMQTGDSPARDMPDSSALYTITQGDATSFQWQPPIDAVACETYLGRPMSLPPAEIKLKQEKQECGTIILGFLKNLAKQIQPETPVSIAVPAWLRPNGQYERLNILDEIEELGYNVKRFRNVGQEDLLYHREKQVVAREIIVLRKK